MKGTGQGTLVVRKKATKAQPQVEAVESSMSDLPDSLRLAIMNRLNDAELSDDPSEAAQTIVQTILAALNELGTSQETLTSILNRVLPSLSQATVSATLAAKETRPTGGDDGEASSRQSINEALMAAVSKSLMDSSPENALAGIRAAARQLTDSDDPAVRQSLINSTSSELLTVVSLKTGIGTDDLAQALGGSDDAFTTWVEINVPRVPQNAGSGGSANRPPFPPTAVQVAADPPFPGGVYSCVPELLDPPDPDGNAVTIETRWMKNGDASALSDLSIWKPAAELSPGDTITCAVRLRDDKGLSSNWVTAVNALAVLAVLADPDAAPNATAAAPVSNRAPSTPIRVTVASTDPRPSGSFSCSVQPGSDPEGGLLQTEFRWWADGTQLAGQTAVTLPAALLTPGKTVTCAARHKDNGGLFSAWRTSENALEVQRPADDQPAAVTAPATNRAPSAPQSVTLAPATVREGQTLTCSIALAGADPDGDPVSHQYQWQLNGVNMAGLTTAFLGSNSFVKGDTIACAVRHVDPTGAASPWTTSSSNATVLNSAPALTCVSTVGATQIGSGTSLTLDPGSALPVSCTSSDPDPTDTLTHTVLGCMDRFTFTGSGVPGGTMPSQNCNLMLQVTDGTATTSVSLTLTANPPTTLTASSAVHDLALHPDGDLLLIGDIEGYGGTNDYRNFLVLDASGSIDQQFSPVRGYRVTSVAVDSQNRIYLGGTFERYGSTTVNHFMRLRADGSLDTTMGYNSSNGFDYDVSRVLISGDQQRLYVFGGFDHYNGTVSPGIACISLATGTDGQVCPPGVFSLKEPNGVDPLIDYAIWVDDASMDPDSGEIFMVIRGQATFDGYAIKRLVKLLPDGTLDDDFTTALGTGFTSTVNTLTVLPNQNIVLVGTEAGNNFNGTVANTLIALNYDGTVNSAFQAQLGAGPSDGDACVHKIYEERTGPHSGKIYLSGGFSTLGGDPGYDKLGRLNADGSLDGTFPKNYDISGNDPLIMATLPDGRLAAGGWADRINGVGTGGLFIFEGNGSVSALEPRNTLGLGSSSDVMAIATFSDNGETKMVVAGEWQPRGGTHIKKMAKVDPITGELDRLFSEKMPWPPWGSLSTVEIMGTPPNEKIYVGGWFDGWMGTAQARDGLFRLNKDGSFDPAWYLQPNGDVDIYLDVQAMKAHNGWLWVGFDLNGQTGKIHDTRGLFRVDETGNIDAAFSDATLFFHSTHANLEINTLEWNPHAAPSGCMLVGGNFTSSQLLGEGAPIPSSGMVCVNEDGSRNTSFLLSVSHDLQLSPPIVTDFVFSDDDRLFVLGHFDTFGAGVVRPGVLELTATNGVSVPAFNPLGTSGDLNVDTGVAVGDGLYLGGSLSDADTTAGTANHIVRIVLTPDPANSASDDTFAAAAGTGVTSSGELSTPVSRLYFYDGPGSNDWIFGAGGVTHYGISPVSNIFRIGADGTLDMPVTVVP